MNDLYHDQLPVSEYAIEDLIDLKQVDEIIEGFSKISNLTITLANYPENKTLVSTKSKKVCSNFHRENEESNQHCEKSYQRLFKNVEFHNGLSVQVCRNGMITCAIPIIINNKQIATLYAAQVFLIKPNLLYFERQAKKFHYELDSYISAIKDVPVCHEEDVEQTLYTIAKTITLLAQMKVSQLKLSQQREIAYKANNSKTEFLANVSHELRTPLHGILSFARYGLDEIKNESVSRDDLAKNFEEIKNSGIELLNIVNDLLDLAKLEAGKVDYLKKENDIACFVDFTFSEMDIIAKEKNINFQMKINAPNIKTIAHFDSSKIQQVLRNLISNAIKFSNSNSNIVVEISNEIRENIEYLVISVVNSGAPIPSEDQKRIFDHYVQSKRISTQSLGTGLGLSICKKIVEDHNGKIWTQNKPNGDTQFTFMLPQREIANQ